MSGPMTSILNSTESLNFLFSGISGLMVILSFWRRIGPRGPGTLRAGSGKEGTGSWRNCGNRHRDAGLGYIRGMTHLIAVVDDEETLRETVGFALRREGYRVEPFPDGLTAWRSFERGLPDLAILDILMPQMDGLELCRRLRALSERLPILFLTSKDEEFDKVLGLELGADDYLCKPFSIRELLARVKVLLRRAALRNEPAGGDDERIVE